MLICSLPRPSAMPRLLTILLIFAAGCLCLFGLHHSAGADEPNYRSLCQELEESGLKPLDSGISYGVPYVEIKVPMGSSVTSICRRVPSLNADFSRCRNRIAFFNALNPSYVKTRTSESNSLEADTLKIPLDLNIVPEIFPAYDPSLPAEGKFILVDLGKGFLALYAHGKLLRVFPVSGGTPEKQSPLISFNIQQKYKDHWSSIYDTWMPWALLIRSPYYIHGGAMPGKRDSAGCIRLFIADAKELYHLVEIGTPGRIIQTSRLERTYPAQFCR
jgi:L,D-transpeptidase catalytic domain